jgi:hypothetical protein
MLPVQVLSRQVLLLLSCGHNSRYVLNCMVFLGNSVIYATNCTEPLPLQEVEYVMLFFLPEGLDDEGDALQPSGDGLELNEYGWQNAASDDTGVQDTAKTRAVTGQSLQDPRVC